MKKLMMFAIAVCVGLAAHAELVAVPVSVSVSGSAQIVAPIVNVAASFTNWVAVKAIYVTVPQSVSGTVELSSHIGGTVCPLTSFYMQGMTNAATVKLVFPRKGVWPDANPAVDTFPILGTNGLIGITQSVTNLNTWSLQLLIER